MPPTSVRRRPIRNQRDGGPARPLVASTSSVPAMVVASSNCDGLASPQIEPAETQPGSPPISASSSAVFSRISASSPRLSTLSRISGSVFDERRLKRHCSNSTLTPSV